MFQIIKDLPRSQDAYTGPYRALNNGSPTKEPAFPMVHLLLSRAYLYMEEWEKATQPT